MKTRIAVLIFTLVFGALADVVTLPQNRWLNLTYGTTFGGSGVTVSSSCAVHPNSSYDFFWSYYDNCTCLCPCCPVITIASPRAFFLSKRAMNGDELKSMGTGGWAQLHDTTVFSECSTGTYPYCVGCKQFDCGQSAKDTLCTRLFVIQLMNGIMRLKINAFYSHAPQCPYGYSEVIDSIAVAYGISTPVKTPAVVQSPLAPVNRHAVIILDGKQMRIDGIYYNVNGKRISAGQKLYHGILLEKIGTSR
jgi:hypothetical protein